MSRLVPLGKSTEWVSFVTENGAGILADPDAGPTVVNVQKNGSDSLESAVTIEQQEDDGPANITGTFFAVFDLAALTVAPNDTISATISFQMDGYIKTFPIDLTIGEFAVNEPKVRVG
ncbi:MAG: hypothetical protein F6K65_30475 [Moorea sp. SIO3C2]|nr:hypothetical protein [Moorena sp. SIO3C2]